MSIKLTAINPKPFNAAAMEHELLQGLKDLGVEIRENFEDTTRTWRNKPDFGPNPNVPVVSGNIARVETTTESLIYRFVSRGTKKNYPIVPVNAKKLRFPSQFIPKTFPGIIGSGVGFSGGEIQYRDGVIHPGVEARKFEPEIKKRQQKNAKIIMLRAMRLAKKASGHAYP
jgi:hypothetical protein